VKVKALADALQLISDYRTRLAAIRSAVALELPVLKGAIEWGKGLVSCGTQELRK